MSDGTGWNDGACFATPHIVELLQLPRFIKVDRRVLVYDFPHGDEPWTMLTADFVMVGDAARPDLASMMHC